MKRKLAISVVALFCAITLSTAGEADFIQGKSMTSLGDYSIKQANAPLIIDGLTFETFLLTYKNAERPIKIGIESKGKCTNFIIKGPNFELEYICKRGVFGAKRINPIYREINENVNDAVISSPEMEAQQVISVLQKTEAELLGLIACYLPLLIKEEFRDQI
ncbi:hypothetical protein ACUNWD_20575 [Sunxiuqinia sp. A32]|uniref:hypothetical protein n=1 Tax=Sunxiuqinia sp. A32 TaxID=3461496 RepID=UPI0040454722